ncbi:acetylcholine receptor subunit alpha-1-A-like [Mytilus trossulus]|uniref:acetylcholine receptor subunit alpha-1-A-like n=1 Tax=Mytilus trossulus TaxID=6551 RepID=UPI003004F268
MCFRHFGVLPSVIIVAYIELIYAQSHADVKRLHTDLFTDYKKEIIPTADQSKPLVIGVTFFIASFNSFNEVDETISLTGAVEMNWTDPALIWDPTLYGNANSTTINPKDLWLPQIYLTNSVDSMNPVGDDSKVFPTIGYTGNVFYSHGGILKAKCPTDISKFPFDSQTCTLELMTWGFLESQLFLSSNFDKAQLGFFDAHLDWNLLEYSTHVERVSYGYSMLKVKLTFKREPLYFTVMIILPTLLFSLLNPLVFVLPVESGERVSLSMTILLSYAIFLTLVSDSIPATSNPMCVLLSVMIAIISISGVIVIGSIMNAKYFYLENDKLIGMVMKYFTKLWMRKMNKVIPIDEYKEPTIRRKDVTEMLDSLFFYGTYILILVIISSYFCYVLL